MTNVANWRLLAHAHFERNFQFSLGKLSTNRFSRVSGKRPIVYFISQEINYISNTSFSRQTKRNRRQERTCLTAAHVDQRCFPTSQSEESEINEWQVQTLWFFSCFDVEVVRTNFFVNIVEYTHSYSLKTFA